MNAHQHTYEELVALDHKYLWHPFTPMTEWLSHDPLIIERAAGTHLVDARGRHYLDGVSSLWVNVHGHRHASINTAIREQLHKVAHSTMLGLSSTPAVLLAAELVRRAPPGLARVFYSDSGSTAVEVALKIAYQYHQLNGDTGRSRFLVLDRSYHGDTLGAVSVGAIPTFHELFRPLLFNPVISNLDTASFEHTFLTHRDSLCAVIMEPLVQGAAGMRLCPPGLLARAAELCRQHGVLLIVDEVATGFGRTGTLFACEQEGVTPDMLCCAKGLSGGYLPLAATLTTAAVFERFLGEPGQRLTFFHGHSFTGNPLACAAALASLRAFDEDRVLENLPAKIAHLRARLDERVMPLPHVAEVRQRGFMVGIELRRDRRHPFPDPAALGAEVCELTRRHGVILRPLGDVIVILPPLSTTTAELDQIVDAAARAIDEATARRARTPTPPLPRGPAPPTAAAPHGPGLFLAGTDTGAGKTTVARALLRLAARRGHPMLPCKPVETGCAPHALDAEALRRASGLDLPLDRVCPFQFPAPLAPALAARQAGHALTLDDLLAVPARVRPAARPLHPVLVESAGGLLSPLTESHSNAELAARLGFPVLLVARNQLGTINHTALTVAELRRRGLRLAGIVLSQVAPDATPDAPYNLDAIAQATGLRPLGILPHVPADATDDALADALERALDPSPLFAAAGLI